MNGDTEEARAIMTEHIMQGAKLLVDRLAKQEIWPPAASPDEETPGIA